MITRRAVLRLAGSALFAAVSLGAYATGVEPMLLTHVKPYAFTPPGWPAGLALRIAVLADIHACRPWMTLERIAGLVEATNVMRPDLILLLGDYMSGMPWVLERIEPAGWAPILAGLAAPLGTCAILGNHDWWHDEAAQQRGGGPTLAGEALRRAGIRLLENDVLRIEKDGHAFWVAGLGDQLALLPGQRWGRSGFVGMDDLAGTMGRITDDAPVLLLAHEPDIFPNAPDRVCLTLSGHTHGGQIRLFGYSPVVPSRFGNRYAYGHVVEGGRNLIVSGGLGCSIAPVRIGVRPEIMLLALGPGGA